MTRGWKILTARQYNKEMMDKWRKKVTEWDGSGIIPQIQSFLFTCAGGKARETGFVAHNGTTALWAKTKAEVIGRAYAIGRGNYNQ